MGVSLFKLLGGADLGMWPKGLFTQRASGWAYPQAECFSSGSLLFWGAKRDHDLKTTLPLHPQIPKKLTQSSDSGHSQLRVLVP